jgi:hypothetical protein
MAGIDFKQARGVKDDGRGRGLLGRDAASYARRDDRQKDAKAKSRGSLQAYPHG